MPTPEDDDRPGPDATSAEIAEWLDGSFSDAFGEGLRAATEECDDESA